MSGIIPDLGDTAFNSAPTLTLALPAHSTLAGCDLVVGISLLTSVVSTPEYVASVTDTGGHTFELRTYAQGDGIRTEIWEAQGVSATTGNVITVTFSSAVWAVLAFEQYEGVYDETTPSPQDVASAHNWGTTITCGVATSSISSWAVGVYGFTSTTSTTFTVTRGTVRQFRIGARSGICLLDVRGYAVPAVGTYGIAPPIGYLTEAEQYATATLELRSDYDVTHGGTGAGDSGGDIPPNPPYVAPPDGPRLSWSYSYTLAGPPAGVNDTSEPATVVCHNVGGGCSGPNAEFGNIAY